MDIKDFDFTLPKELIAYEPLQRGAAKMLDATSGGFRDLRFTDLVDLLKPHDVLVLNETKVLPAKLEGYVLVANGGASLHSGVGINLIEKRDEDKWYIYARPARKLVVGGVIYFANTELNCQVLEKQESGQILVQFNMSGERLQDQVEAIGKMPLPPYIKRKAHDGDKQTFQTVFAKNIGSVAAPTAGLHFTEEVLQAVQAKGVSIAKVTLHVGRGTFEPVKTQTVESHKMHSEEFIIDEKNAQIINYAKQNGGRVICVGTTSMRVLESIASSGIVAPSSGSTDIFIKPGYKFKIVDVLLTNFHLPKSTLFILVSTILGRERALAMYQHAIAQRYRFFSYGDCCLLPIDAQ